MPRAASAEAIPGSLVERIVEVDDERLPVETAESLAHGRGKLPVGDQGLRFAVSQDVGDGAGVQPRVDGIEHGAERGHALVEFEHGRNIGQDHGHRIALADAACRQRRSEAAGSRVELPVADAPLAVNDGSPLRIDGCRA